MSDCKHNCSDNKDHRDHGVYQDLGDLRKMVGKDEEQHPFVQELRKEQIELNEGQRLSPFTLASQKEEQKGECGGGKCEEKKKCGKDEQCH